MSARGAVVLGLALAVLASAEGAAAFAVRSGSDRARQVEAGTLAAALVTFRPPGRSGERRDVTAADLDPTRAVRTTPARCSALTLLTVQVPLDGQSWTGINGNPAQPVNTLTARFADADAARAELADKRRAALLCDRVQLVFPPFDEPAQPYDVTSRWWLPGRTDRFAYTLIGAGGEHKRYDFYVRRYANTVTWSYGDLDGREVRRQVVDDLAGRLAELG